MGTRLGASLAAIYACIFANGLGMGLSLPLLSLTMERHGVSSTLIGANTMAGAVAMIAVTPFIPTVAARFGTARTLIASYAIAALSIILFRATGDLIAWFALRFTFNAALQTLFVASEVWINQVSPTHLRGRLIGIYTAIFSAGFALGPLLIQVLGTQGWPPFVAGSLTMLAAMTPLLVTPQHLIPAIEPARASAMFNFVFSSPSAAAAALTYGAIESAAGAFLPVYAVREGATEQAATLLVAALGIGNMVLVPFLGWYADKTDRRFALILCGVGCILCPVFLPLTQGADNTALLLTLFWGGFASAIYAVGLAHLGANFIGAQLASANSAFAILYASGCMAGPAMSGLAMDAWDPYGMILILALIPAVFTALIAYRAATFPRPKDQLTSDPE